MVDVPVRAAVIVPVVAVVLAPLVSVPALVSASFAIVDAAVAVGIAPVFASLVAPVVAPVGAALAKAAVARQRGVEGKCVSLRVDLRGGAILKKKNKTTN